MGNLSLDKRVNFGVLLAVTFFILWYLYDAYKALASIENLILIGPIAIVTLGLCAAEFIRYLREDEKTDSKKESIRDVLPAMVIFSGYILSLEYLGFDIGTTLFTAIFLKVHGEKNWKLIVIYSLLFGFLVPYFFSQMLPYPMPMSILPTDY
ncbi:tripartite tricarboxylate transporter TctB family protein [Sulfurospirillum arcachonense]|uniref:tripartite tricarboxylate transporter TctB family protein n=1 Tax=Sulfurospirillum arcachonense TaxID=57666 RepID=UPI000468246B|nr:tripartite tricarboxylate transporter TctB family protein [Sulfurospirillum arcachonense]